VDLSRAVSLGVSLVVHMNIGRRAAATATLPFGRCGGRFIGGVARSPVARGTPPARGRGAKRVVGLLGVVVLLGVVGLLGVGWKREGHWGRRGRKQCARRNDKVGVRY
jgi:hypothetical protein